MRKPLAALSALAAAALLGVAAPSVESASRTVRITDNAFSPSSTSVRRGDTVTWRWTGRAAHNVVVKSGPVRFQSSLKRSGTFKRRLTRRGTYSIVCTIHSGMAMKVRVR